ncbi:outer membrane protein assembly factor BamE [Segnochrobactraceae bacterium EtOH-i3]
MITGTVAILLAGGLAACTSETFTHGYVVTDELLAQIPVGSSREQVLLALGTPSTVGTLGGEVFYYISQTMVQQARFMKPKLVDQRVLAVYFDKEGRVTEIGNYGMKDGKVFDYITRRTRTGGSDYGFVTQILQGAAVGPSMAR